MSLAFWRYFFLFEGRSKKRAMTVDLAVGPYVCRFLSTHQIYLSFYLPFSEKDLDLSSIATTLHKICKNKEFH